MKQMMIEFRSLVEDMNVDGLSASLSELQSLHDMQEEYLVQLETEKTLLLNNIAELGKEILNSSPALSRKSSTDWLSIHTLISISILSFST